MATIKKGVLTEAGEWWKHLRWTKRNFWKGERQAGKKAATKEVSARPSEHPFRCGTPYVRD